MARRRVRPTGAHQLPGRPPNLITGRGQERPSQLVTSAPGVFQLGTERHGVVVRVIEPTFGQHDPAG